MSIFRAGIRWLAMLGIVGCLSPAPARGASPFEIVPLVATNSGRACLSLGFRVPAAHLLYAEKLEFHLEGTTNRLRFRLPDSVPVKDRFSGQRKLVYASSFTADWILPKRRPEPLRIAVLLQGCSGSSCFFPETRRFEVDARGAVRELVEASRDERRDARQSKEGTR
jgi:thiol:disulfide interchange protein